MSRGVKNLSTIVKGIIVEEALKDPKRHRELVTADIKERIKKVYEPIPQDETIKRYISEARSHPVSDLDSQWSVGRLAQCDIPPEALAVVLSIYEQRLRTEEYSFTIREALWIGRLYKVIDDPLVLELFASAYALRDKIDWILDNPVYTRDFDFGLIEYNNEDGRAEFVARLTQFPGAVIHPLPTWGRGEEEELRKKSKGKGYTLP